MSAMDPIFIPIIATLIFSVILHELGHGYAALALGDYTAKQQNRLSLNPIHHIDPFFTIIMPVAFYYVFGIPFGGAKPVPVNPNFFKYTSPRRGMLLVAIAGPLINFLLCLVALTLSYAISSNQESLRIVISYFFVINAIIMVFNLLPIPYLDGPKILIGLLPKEKALKFTFIERYGLFILIFLFITQSFFYLINLIIDVSNKFLPYNFTPQLLTIS